MADELDKVLSEAEKASSRDLEIQRILDCNSKDYYHILEVFPNDEGLARKNYRKKSLLIHPDKSDNPDAPIAFDRLQKAYSILEDQVKSEDLQKLIDIYKHIQETNNSNKDIRHQVNRILIEESKEEELREKLQKRQEAKDNEEFETLKQQREIKKKLEKNWDDNRDIRVDNWRSFVKKVEKKKIKKKKFLA